MPVPGAVVVDIYKAVDDGLDVTLQLRSALGDEDAWAQEYGCNGWMKQAPGLVMI